MSLKAESSCRADHPFGNKRQARADPLAGRCNHRDHVHRVAWDSATGIAPVSLKAESSCRADHPFGNKRQARADPLARNPALRQQIAIKQEGEPRS
ncbi:hypothetical protein [Sphingomonas sp. VDB2]|uniref:hypothetical protein n=1 Tax=Sphingomonas sp. VDB2 TaxID=3228751 RepID=UPI003A7FCC3F